MERLSPSLAEIEALTLTEMQVADGSWPAFAGLDLPDHVTLHLDPAGGTQAVDLCLDWGILTSGTMRLPTAQHAAEFLGSGLLGPNAPQSCHHVPTAATDDIYGCAWDIATCTPSAIESSQPASTSQEVDAFVAGLDEVRLLHPYMVAYPCAGPQDRTPMVDTDRAAIFTTQFATTGDGLAWADAFRESGTAGDNDTQGAAETWNQAWETAARHGAMVLWLGDVSFPRRWYPAAPRSPDNPLGIVCDPQAPKTGWWTANDFTGLLFFTLHVAAQAMGDAPLPDEVLATFSAMPYMRALSTGATFLTRYGESLGLATPPSAFSVAGASKGGMGCLYATLGDPRIEHGLCKVFDAFDTETDRDMMHRMVSDWGLCQPGGKRADGCATGNFSGFPGPSVLPFLGAAGAATEHLWDTWSLGRLLPDLACAAPEDDLFVLNGTPDFHWSVGSNDAMWRERAVPPDQVHLLHRLNADHGMSHLAPDDAPEGLTMADWTHGVQDFMGYRAFFTAHEPPTLSWTDPPHREGDRLVGQVEVSPGTAGVRLWVAASRDRDYSLCTGIELPGDAFMCRGEFFCQDDPSVVGASCPGQHLGQSCAWIDDPGTDPNKVAPLRRAMAEANPLPTRTASGHFCWWREDDGSGRPPWEQCLAPAVDLGGGAITPPNLTTAAAIENLLDSPSAPYRLLERYMRGTYADLAALDGGVTPPTDPGQRALPRTFRFRAYGASSAQAVLQAGGFVDPYATDMGGAYRQPASGFFLPYPAELEAGGVVNVDWPIPPGIEADHFAVTVEAWAPADDGVPDVVYTPILTVGPEPDPAALSCG